MHISSLLSKQLHDVHFGGNWTSVNLKEVLSDVTWQQAVHQIYSMNTIASLVYHMNYYIRAASSVLKGQSLNASDKLSFNVPPIGSEEDWQAMLNGVWNDAEVFAGLIAEFPEERLAESFTDEKYGTYYRNIQGIIEHMHYHLGQIVLIKKIIQHHDG
jgi:hypothetical protein